MMHPTFVLCAVLVLGTFSSAAAQEASVATGSRVRLWTEVNEKGRPAGPRTMGQIAAWNSDSLILNPVGAGNRRSIPITSVSRMDVSRGQRSMGMGALRGGALGLIIGGATGMVLGYTSGDDDSFLFNRWQDKAAIFSVMLGTPGTLVGAVVGANRPGERWERVAVPARVSISPNRKALALSTSLRF